MWFREVKASYSEPFQLETHACLSEVRRFFCREPVHRMVLWGCWSSLYQPILPMNGQALLLSFSFLEQLHGLA